MGAYTSLKVFSTRPRWLPDGLFLLRLFEFLEVKSMWMVSGYAGTSRWNAEDPQPELFSEQKIAVQRGVELFLEKRCKYTLFGLNSKGLNQRLSAQVNAVFPEELAGGFTPWDLSVGIGPFTLPDLQMERTAYRASCQVSFSGHGMPTELDTFLEMANDTHAIKELLDWLLKESKHPWRTTLSCSF